MPLDSSGVRFTAAVSTCSSTRCSPARRAAGPRRARSSSTSSRSAPARAAASTTPPGICRIDDDMRERLSSAHRVRSSRPRYSRLLRHRERADEAHDRPLELHDAALVSARRPPGLSPLRAVLSSAPSSSPSPDRTRSSARSAPRSRASSRGSAPNSSRRSSTATTRPSPARPATTPGSWTRHFRLALAQRPEAARSLESWRACRSAPQRSRTDDASLLIVPPLPILARSWLLLALGSANCARPAVSVWLGSPRSAAARRASCLNLSAI